MKRALIEAWRRHGRAGRPRYRVRTVPTRSAVPARLPARTLILVGRPAKWALLRCPCGRGHDISLNLSQPETVRWRIDSSRRQPSLHPSVDVHGSDFRCHFFLRFGKVEWVS